MSDDSDGLVPVVEYSFNSVADALERQREREQARMRHLEEFARRVDQGWVPFGWHIAYPEVRLEFDGESECGDPVWERNAAWGLTPTELEADRNTALGRGDQ